MKDRAQIVHDNFINRVRNNNFPSANLMSDCSLSNTDIIEIFESQCLSRGLDNISRILQAKGEGFYTIGSSGHEGMAAISKAFRHNDMAFLHYRDAAFFIQRSKKISGQTIAWDMLLSFVASSDDPISGGRHKVLGSKDLFVPPQTSTIASHIPKAVGTAFSIGTNKAINNEGLLKDDGVILCSFGDASLNHSTAQGAINTASWCSYQNVDMPMIFICEDNNIGISTRTPKGWVRSSMENREGIKYFRCNGLDIMETYEIAKQAEEYVRENRKPAFIHMKCVRLFGHAGPDVQTAYMGKEEIEWAEANDPLIHTASILINNNVLTSSEVLEVYNQIEGRLERSAEQVIKHPKLETPKDVMETIIPPIKNGVVKNNSEGKIIDDRLNLARNINHALDEIMDDHDNVVLMGEDIGPKGGVYTVTKDLYNKFGGHRVINTLLDEQSILGLAIGMAHNNIISIPEIQFLAYLHNAEDQLRGEAATLSFFSNGQFNNPMVIRIAGLAYQKGFGGHFHNDNSFAVLRDIPGIIIACPSNAADAPAMLKECVRLAKEEQRIIVFLEPIALYMMRDLHEPKDGKWLSQYDSTKKISLGQVGVRGEGKDICILTYANGYYLSCQVEKILKDQHEINIRIVDLRWLAPLDKQKILKAISPCKKLLIVDECRKTGSLSEQLTTMFKDDFESIEIITAEDSFIPLGKAATVTLPNKDDIVNSVLKLK